MDTPARSQSQTQALFIGLMSGTSLDGIDAVVADLSQPGRPRILGHADTPIAPALRTDILALHTPGHNELHRAMLVSQALAQCYAQVCRQVLQRCQLSPGHIRAIGVHGQTVRHCPEHQYTLQLNAPATLAEHLGIDVIADFRSRDMAAGGQGAPLVPLVHQALFGVPAQTRVVLNLGGIANISILQPDQPVRGFDTGPANMLLDAWCQQHTGQPYDQDGAWAASGHENAELLAYFLASEPWFNLPAPKSTGRDRFNLDWLHQRLAHAPGSTRRLAPQDVQATLQALTARTVTDAILSAVKQVDDVLVCGGGAYNTGLLQALRQKLPCPLSRTDEHGIPAQWVEALCFAWLAQAFTQKKPGNLPDVTGAAGPRILGCLYPA